MLTHHPAMTVVSAFLESLEQKNSSAFASSFDEGPFFANLPGGVKVESSKKIIEMHHDFFASSVSKFEYREPQYVMVFADCVMCSVNAFVVLPNKSKRNVNIDITVRKTNTCNWVVCRLINTVIDQSQIAIE